MVIRISSGKETDALIADLASEKAVTRDGAVARLSVIGTRAVQRLLAVARDEARTSTTRAAAFRALEAIGDPRALEPALEGASLDDPLVATAAIAVARVFLQTTRGVTAVDRLTAIALNEERPSEVRVAAVKALADLDPGTVKPLLAALADSPNQAVAEAARAGTGKRRASSDNPAARLKSAAEGRLPDDPALLKRAISKGGTVPVNHLLEIVEHIRVREGSEDQPRRAEWMAARAAAHAALAERGSRLALHDLRETIEGARQPVAVEFLAAMTSLGDTTCLEAVAMAYARAMANPRRDEWWCRSLADVFRAIVSREGVSKRHAIAKKIDKKWPGTFQAITEQLP